jgi:hypothetical protein
MKSITHPARLLCSGLVLALATLLPLSAAPNADKMPMMDKMSDGKMAEHCKDMMKQKKTMAAEMKADDDALATQVSSMNSAPQADKLALLAAVVTKMSDQRVAMNASHAKMEESMMTHMMEHMQQGPTSMAGCPMMKSMDEKSMDQHKDHAK